MKYIGNNELGNYRFPITLQHNAAFGWNWAALWGPDPGESMDLSYTQLIDAQRLRLCGDTREMDGQPALTQSFRNHLSTLHGFLASIGKTVDSRVGVEFTTSFDKRIHEYLSGLQVSAKSKTDRRSHLRSWKATVEVLSQAGKTRASSESPFHIRLRQAVAAVGEEPKAIARRCEASYSAFRRWLHGSFPNRRALTSLRRIETALGLPRDELVRLVPWSMRGKVSNPDDPARNDGPEIAYRKKLKERSLSQYVLKEDEVSPGLEAEWQNFFHYKTTRMPKLKRSTKGCWSMVSEEIAAPGVPSKGRRGGQASSAAGMNWGYIECFLGYVRLPLDQGGAGVAPDEAGTMAWLAVPELVNGYMEFITTRSDGLVHGGQRQFAAFVASLVRPDFGYLRQQPEMLQRLPGRISDGVSWETLCSESYELAKTWKRTARDISRKPEEPILGLLNLNEPLQPILSMVDKIDKLALEASPGSVQEARRRRDALLIAMLYANPLRSRQFSNMRWRPDNSGNLYRTADGKWRLRFDPREMKNGKSSAARGYDAPLPSWLSARIEAYLEEFRPMLLGDAKDNGFVFPSSRDGRVWKQLGRHVANLTRRYIPGCPGFGPHAFRHLVATNWLRHHPNDFLTVAELLSDSLQVVLSNYAHLRKDDSFDRYEAYVDSMRARSP